MKDQRLPHGPHVYGFENAPRCTATSKRTGKPCQAPAVRGWRVCRFHGAKGGAPRGEAHGNYKTGLRTLEMKEERHRLRELILESKEFTAMMQFKGDR